MGLCSFFRRVIDKFSEIASPLTKLTRKDSGYTKGPLPEEAELAFQTLKQKFSGRPTLWPPNFNLPFILTTDASKIALGAVLSQNIEGTEYPIAYFSRTLKPPETIKAPFHLEYQAMVESAKHFMPYLHGRKFKIRTDHKPLLSLNKQKQDAFDRLQVQLAEYDCDIEYMKGSDMIADGLSRLVTNTHNITTQQTNTPIKNIQPIDTSAFPNISKQEIIKLQQADTACKAMFVYKRHKQLPIDNELRQIALKICPKCFIQK